MLILVAVSTFLKKLGLTPTWEIHFNCSENLTATKQSLTDAGPVETRERSAAFKFVIPNDVYDLLLMKKSSFTANLVALTFSQRTFVVELLWSEITLGKKKRTYTLIFIF